MKLYKNLAILVVVVALLVGAYFVVNKYVKPADETAAEAATTAETIKVTDYLVDDIKKITLVNADGTFIIEKQDKSWVVTSPADLKTNSSKVSSIPTNLASIFADKIAAENVAEDKLKDFGLNSPVELAFVLQDGTEKTLQIGSATPTNSGYYVRLKGEATVYVIGEYSATALLVTKADLLDTTVLTVAAADIISLSMDKKGESFFQAKKVDDSTWEMTAPISVEADYNTISTITAALEATTNYKELVATNPASLEEFGLATPAYAFGITTATGSSKLLLGKEKVKGSEIYAMLEGSKEVFTIDETSYTFLDKPIEEMVYSFVYLPTISNLTKIELTVDGVKTEFGLEIYKDADGKSDNDKDKFTVDGMDISTLKDKNNDQLFRNFYKTLAGITIDTVDYKSVPTGTAEITVKYYQNVTPGTVTVEYVSKDADTYYAFVDGKYTGLTVSKNQDDMGIAGMRASYAVLMDAVNSMKAKQ